MHHLVVGQGQDEVLRESVHQREGDVLVVELPEVGVQLHVMGDVVHPAHVPLQVEAQAALVHRVGHQGPGGGLLGDHQHVGVGDKDVGVEGAQEVDGLQILVAAVLVGHPLAALAAVVQVEHGGHGVHPQAVDVVLLQPEEGGGEQEGADFLLVVVKHPWCPSRRVRPFGGRHTRSRARRQTRTGRRRPWGSGRAPNPESRRCRPGGAGR